MSDNHSQAFLFYMLDQDGELLSQAQRSELEAHLSVCPSCRADQRIYRDLRIQASRRWPADAAPVDLEQVLRGAQTHSRLRWVTLPLQAALWVGLAVVAIILIQWIFISQRPIPAVQPPGGPTPIGSNPEVTPAAGVDESGKITVEPLLAGSPSGNGSWSPKGDYYFIPFLDSPTPGGDRRTTRLHFIAADSGKDCPASETFLGPQGSQNNAWLANDRVLFIDKQGRALLFTPCQDGFQDLSERFSEPLVRVAMPLTAPEQATSGTLLLEAPSAYWLLDAETLQAHPLAAPLPSPESGDTFAWVPGGRRISISQPVAVQPELSRLVLLDLDSGAPLRADEIKASMEEGRAPLVEWLGPERAVIWSTVSDGPLLLDLSTTPPKQVRVLPDLFGLSLEYPTQMSSMGAFTANSDGGYHIVAHVDLPDDKSIYLYHSESGQVEKLAGEQQVMMILPGEQGMAFVPWQDVSTFEDRYDFIWVDRPEQPQVHLQVTGHTPRNSPYLPSRLLPDGTRMLFGSTQGISLVSLPGGETLAFWRLAGAENATLPTLELAPNGRALVAIAHLNNSSDEDSPLYWLSLEESGTR